jgi:hypothetical protein
MAIQLVRLVGSLLYRDDLEANRRFLRCGRRRSISLDYERSQAGAIFFVAELGQ